MKGNGREAQTTQNKGYTLGVVDGPGEDDHRGRGELIREVEKMRVFVFQREKEVVLQQCRDCRVSMKSAEVQDQV